MSKTFPLIDSSDPEQKTYSLLVCSKLEGFIAILTIFFHLFSCYVPWQVTTHSVAVDTCDMSTLTDPDCLGPCEPGTSVNLEGIVWHETDQGKEGEQSALFLFVCPQITWIQFCFFCWLQTGDSLYLLLGCFSELEWQIKGITMLLSRREAQNYDDGL